jgi:ribosomal protein L11 methylase PrmA
VALNGLPSRLPVDVVDGRFDAVVSIDAAYHFQTRERFFRGARAALAPGGRIVLSGLLAPDVPGVLSSYAAQGFTLVRRIDLEGWASLRLRRGGAGRRPII